MSTEDQDLIDPKDIFEQNRYELCSVCGEMCTRFCEDIVVGGEVMLMVTYRCELCFGNSK